MPHALQRWPIAVIRWMRRRLTTTLWGLMLLVLVVAVLLGRAVNQANAQRRVVAAIEKAGGKVEYDAASSKRWEALCGRFGAFSYLHRQLGADFFISVSEVTFYHTTVGIDELNRISELRRLPSVTFVECQMPERWSEPISTMDGLRRLSLLLITVNDSDLAPLRRLKALQELRIFDPLLPHSLKEADEGGVTDAGCLYISEIKSLHKLDLGCRAVTGVGLSRLSVLRELQELWLGATKMTDRDLVHLARLTNLRQLSLCPIPVRGNGSGLKALTNVSKLQTLHLTLSRANERDRDVLFSATGAEQITVICRTINGFHKLRSLDLSSYRELNDDDLPYLDDLPNLESLDVSGSGVSDAGLPSLYGMARLSTLNLKRTHVTSEGVEKLRENLPSLVNITH